MKEIGGSINHQKSLKTKIPLFYGISTSIHKPPKVIENKNTAILWDFDIHTDRAIQTNRPRIVVKNHNDKTCFLIDVSVPSDSNASFKIFGKLSTYKDLEIDVIKMWHLKTITLLVVIGT